MHIIIQYKPYKYNFLKRLRAVVSQIAKKPIFLGKNYSPGFLIDILLKNIKIFKIRFTVMILYKMQSLTILLFNWQIVITNYFVLIWFSCTAYNLRLKPIQIHEKKEIVFQMEENNFKNQKIKNSNFLKNILILFSYLD